MKNKSECVTHSEIREAEKKTFSRLTMSFVCPAVIDVTYLLEEGSGRRLRRRTLGLSDFVSRK